MRLVWVHDESFLHSVASTFHSFVTRLRGWLPVMLGHVGRRTDSTRYTCECKCK